MTVKRYAGGEALIATKALGVAYSAAHRVGRGLPTGIDGEDGVPGLMRKAMQFSIPYQVKGLVSDQLVERVVVAPISKFESDLGDTTYG